MKQFLKRLNVQGRGFVIKPNWSNAKTFTSAETLGLLFNCLEGKKTVVEGYTAWRNNLNIGSEPQEVVTPANARRKWKWIREQDDWFLKQSGIESVLREHDVQYLNVTEEVWCGRTTPDAEIRNAVEKEFSPVRNKEMYGFVPQRIYHLKGSALVSLNLSRKTREVVSLSTKNLFGLIPDPARYGRWHGKNDALLPQSIVDINRIYRSLFTPCYWINEVKDLDLLIGSENSVLADAVTATLMGVDPVEIAYLQAASKAFGGYKQTLVLQALKDWK